MGSGSVGRLLTPDLLQYFQFNQPTMTTATRLTANQAKSAIYDLADDFSWETVAKEMVARMSGDEARDFLEDFIRLYAD